MGHHGQDHRSDCRKLMFASRARADSAHSHGLNSGLTNPLRLTLSIGASYFPAAQE